MIEATITLDALNELSPFLQSWVEKSPDLDIGGVYLDFAKSEAVIQRLPTAANQSASNAFSGIGCVKFEHTLTAGQIDSGVVLVAPLHKLLQAIKWDIQAKVPTKIKIDDSGDTYICTKGNTIFLSADWRKVSDDPEETISLRSLNLSPNSAFSVLKDIIKKKANNITKGAMYIRPSDDLTSLAAFLKKQLPYETETTLGKINPSLSYYNSPLGKTAVSYSRMCLAFSTLNELVFPDSISYVAGDKDSFAKSFDVTFLREMQVLIKQIASAERDPSYEDSIKIAAQIYHHDVQNYKTYAQEHATEEIDNSMHMLSLSSPGDKFNFAFIIPEVIGAQPPSPEDIEEILPQNIWRPDFAEGLTFSVNRQELFETLEFWDQLSKTEVKDLVTPLRPIQLEISDDFLKLKMNSSTGGESSADLACSSFEMDNSAEGFIADPFYIPMDSFLKVLENPLFASDDPEIEDVTFTRTDGSISLKVYNEKTNRTSIAVLAEFV